MTEFDLIRTYFGDLGSRRTDVLLGVGDDGAVVQPPAGQTLVLATDCLVDAVHFPKDAPVDAIGEKALAVNLSDLAAMGAQPAWFQLVLTLPKADQQWLRQFATGLGRVARYHQMRLVGGDTARGPLNVTVQVAGLAPPGAALRRCGARPGDAIVVSGTLGDAALGLDLWRGRADRDDPDVAFLLNRLHRPTPRVSLGQALRGRATAAVDISDGLAADLGHILSASGLGATVDVDRLPLSEPGLRFGGRERQWGGALAGGDDYELCFTMPPSRLHELDAIASRLGVSLTRIGYIQPQPGLRLVRGDRTPVTLAACGYSHFPEHR
ncbi:thiamine-phosphate kinase [Aquisalimonas sp.]|uniref:thiamine-phosphate kinase n=1 Tax=Aquisalimonas sp. TaxID=1872621 RepID=UPI0025BFDAD4|nr:thiamine-phosphate kinase [Aquisalimonas sp.]